jgi:hypothetical protein
MLTTTDGLYLASNACLLSTTLDKVLEWIPCMYFAPSKLISLSVGRELTAPSNSLDSDFTSSAMEAQGPLVQIAGCE